MTITDHDRKLLWGRSGNRCAICRRLLVVERTEADWILIPRLTPRTGSNLGFNGGFVRKGNRLLPTHCFRALDSLPAYILRQSVRTPHPQDIALRPVVKRFEQSRREAIGPTGPVKTERVFAQPSITLREEEEMSGSMKKRMRRAGITALVALNLALAGMFAVEAMAQGDDEFICMRPDCSCQGSGGGAICIGGGATGVTCSRDGDCE